MKKLRIRNILVPIDFSDLSIKAIDVAKNLARRSGAAIHLGHVHQWQYPAGFMGPVLSPASQPVSFEEHRTETLVAELRQLAARSGLAPENCHVRQGAPVFHEVCQLASEIGADLIVTPTHGHGGLKHLLLGSTAERVVQHSPCPVLVTRGTVGAFDKILVPIDFSGCSLDALNYAIEFAETVAARIVVFHAVYLGYAYATDGYAMYDFEAITESVRKDAERQMREFVRTAKFGGVKFETEIRVGPPVDEICAFAANTGVNAIVLGTHGRTGFGHVLIGSVAEQVVRNADRPVLVVPSHPKIRVAALAREPKTARTSRSSRPNGLGSRRKPAMARAYPEPMRHPLPERRKTNKFRETHTRI